MLHVFFLFFFLCCQSHVCFVFIAEPWAVSWRRGGEGWHWQWLAFLFIAELLSIVIKLWYGNGVSRVFLICSFFARVMCRVILGEWWWWWCHCQELYEEEASRRGEGGTRGQQVPQGRCCKSKHSTFVRPFHKVVLGWMTACVHDSSLCLCVRMKSPRVVMMMRVNIGALIQWAAAVRVKTMKELQHHWLWFSSKSMCFNLKLLSVICIVFDNIVIFVLTISWHYRVCLSLCRKLSL